MAEHLSGTMCPVAMTVAMLLAQPDLGLRVVCPGGPGALDRPVTWAHQSEQADPAQYSEPHEVLLTTGLAIPLERTTDPAELAAACDGYVRRLRTSQAVALGFGSGVHHPRVPTPMVEAAREHGFPIFEVPFELPFSAIIKAVSRALVEEENAQLRRTHAAQRRLLAAAGASDVVRSVVVRTAQLVGGWAAFADATGRVLEISHLAARPVAERAIDAHTASRREATFTDADGIHLCTQDVIAPGGDPLGVLVAGTRSPFDTFTSAVPLLATSLLAVSVPRLQTDRTSMRRMRSVVMGRLLDGDVSLARSVAADLWAGLPREPFTLVCVSGPSPALAALQDDLAPLYRERHVHTSPVAFGEHHESLWLVVAAHDAEELVGRLSSVHEVVCGASEPATWDHLDRARRAASNAMVVELARGRSRATGPTIGTRLDLPELFDADQSRAFAQVVLGDLLADTPSARTLLTTLRRWLAAPGGIDQTAAELGVHRHTVRRRLARVSAVLGVDLDDPPTRHELWFACRLWQSPREGGEPTS